jgi:hypothetical protein
MYKQRKCKTNLPAVPAENLAPNSQIIGISKGSGQTLKGREERKENERFSSPFSSPGIWILVKAMDFSL